MIYHQTPPLGSTAHFGSRLVFNRDGMLCARPFATCGKGPDGAVYLLTDGSSGKLLKLIPKR